MLTLRKSSSHKATGFLYDAAEIFALDEQPLQTGLNKAKSPLKIT
jgi:hypothetical protein